MRGNDDVNKVFHYLFDNFIWNFNISCLHYELACNKEKIYLCFHVSRKLYNDCLWISDDDELPFKYLLLGDKFVLYFTKYFYKWLFLQ